VRGRRFHGGDEPARRGIDGDDVGERPTDVDPDAEAAGARIQDALRMEEPRSRWRLRIDPSDAMWPTFHRAMQGRANRYLEHLINDLHIVPAAGDNVFYGHVNLGIDLGDENSNERNLLERDADALAALDRAGIHDQRSARASSS
jgi:hypothetical protein